MVINKKSLIPFASLLNTSLVSEEHLFDVGLSSEAFKPITRLLGRIPNKVELALIGALWSERCCEKSTRAHLSKLACGAKTPFLLKNNYSLLHKLKSVRFFERAWLHSLSSLIGELVVLGGEPIALAHSFYLPTLDAEAERSALGELAHYCYELGIPSIKSDIYIDACDEVALANFSALALLKKEPCPEKAWGAKNRVLMLGQACDDFSFDPQRHKRLFALCSRAIEQDLLVGASSIGVAGLAFAAFRLASQGASGLLIHIDELPPKNPCSLERQLLSESPGRMLVIVEPKQTLRMRELSQEFDVFCADIGSVNNDGFVRIVHEGHEVVHMGATMLLENAPRLRLKYQSIIPKRPDLPLKDQIKLQLGDCLRKVLHDFVQERSSHPASFDAHIGLNTLIAKDEADAAVIDLSRAGEHIALALISDTRLVRLNAHEAAKRAFLASSLQLAAQGAPIQGISCALSAGSCEQETVMTTIKQVIDAMAECASYFKIPVVSAGAALEYHAATNAVLTVAAFGLSKKKRSVRFGNAKKGDLLVMLGHMPTDFLGIERLFEKPALGNGYTWDLAGIERLMAILCHCVHEGISSSVSVLGRGGFYGSLLSIMAKTGLGLRLDFGPEWLSSEIVLSLFSEESPRVLLALDPDQMHALRTICAHKTAVYTLGSVGGDKFAIFHQGELLYEAR